MASSLNVALLLHMDGANGSTSFPDSSLNNLTVTANVGAEISTAQSKFGGASSSLEVSGKSGDYLTLENNAALSLSSSDNFTIDCWVRPISFFGRQTIFSTGDVAVDGFRFAITSTQGLEVDDFSGNVISDTSATGTLSVDTWHHVALSVESNTWRVFLDGVLQGYGTRTSTYPNNANMFIGQSLDSVPRDRLAAFVDEYRIVTNEADFTANFTPPISAYPNPSADDREFRASIPSPLAAPEAVVTVANPIATRIEIPSPLSPPQVVASNDGVQPDLIISIPSPLAAPRLQISQDFTAFIGSETQSYLMRITGSPIIEMPISSWQATLQTDRQDYVQCVVPAADQYSDDLSARQGSEEFVIYRYTTIDGVQVETEMARAPLSTVVINSGAFRSTATLSGYKETANDPASGTVAVTGVRQFNNTLNGNARVRCDIDWVLRPGQTVDTGDTTLTANYINYFVPARGDAYMDVGSRG